MRNERSKTANARYIPERAGRREFRGGAKGVVFCGDCGIAYYKKSWHRNLRHFASFEKDVPIVFRTCPACAMIKNKQYEGRVTLLEVPLKLRSEVLRLIHSYGERAYARDPLDRVIEVKKTKSGFEITTTENQLAQKLGQKIAETFKPARVSIAHSPQPSDVAFVTVAFV